MKKLFLRLLLAVICLFLFVQIWIFASLAYWRFFPVDTTMFMRIYYFTTPNAAVYQQWQDYDDISPYFKRAVIAGEDQRFLSHHGFDWDGMQAAIEHNEESGEVLAGGSTISQQLAKNLFLFPQRSYLRKGEEAIATWMMERMWPKQRILEVYMNSVELGDGIYGVQAASKHYFSKTAKNLTASQAVQLAAMLPNPRYYQAHPSDRRYKFHQRFITKYMYHMQIPSNRD